jgi:hypothetical protein
LPRWKFSRECRPRAGRPPSAGGFAALDNSKWDKALAQNLTGRSPKSFDGRDRLGLAAALSGAGVVAIAVLAGAELLWPINRELGIVNALGAAAIGVASFLFFKLGRSGQRPVAPRAGEVRS